MSDNVPSHATKVAFTYGRSMQGVIYVWQTKGGKYQWSAMGNCGEGRTRDEAIDQAREWIVNDYDPLNDPLK